MTQFLVRKTHHTTGEVFLDATKAKENETFVLVDAESAEEAKERVKDKKQCPRCDSRNTDIDELIEEQSKRKLGFAFKCNDCGTYAIY